MQGDKAFWMMGLRISYDIFLFFLSFRGIRKGRNGDVKPSKKNLFAKSIPTRYL